PRDRPARRRQAAHRPRREHREPGRGRDPGEVDRGVPRRAEAGEGVRPDHRRPHRDRPARPGSLIRGLVGRAGLRGGPAPEHSAGPHVVRGQQGAPAPVPHPRHQLSGGIAMSGSNTLARLKLGTAPDSWGVWFPEDPHQVTWQQYLDELPKAGYVWTELGPQGFLPQDPQQLRDELDRRGLKVCGGTVFAGLHRGADALKEAIDSFSREARLLTAVGARYLVHL